MVKIYNICSIMNSNQKYVLKLLFLTVNNLLICWNLDVTFTLCQVRSHGDIQGQLPKIFCAFLCQISTLLATP